MRNKTVIGLLCGIVLLALTVRLYNLENIPPGPFLDEVANGYNAYSLLLTGKDEYGRGFPILLQAFNDFRPALFVYLSIPLIKLFGLSIFSIRLPAVLLTVAATVSLFFLIKLILSYRQKPTKLHTIVALSGALLYAISPWSLYSSRFSNEINMSLSFFIYALTFFFAAITRPKQDKKSALALLTSIILFVVAFYAYHGIKLFLPIFLVILIIIFFKDLWQRKKTVIVGGILGILLLIPLILAFQDPQTRLRLGAVNIFTQRSDIIAESSQRLLYDQNQGDIFGQLFDNRRTLIFLEIAKNYFKNYDPSWLYSFQNNISFQLADFGPFHLFELPLLLIGIFFLIKYPTPSRKIKLFLLLWILTAPLPSAFSTEAPQLNRSNPLLPALIITEAFGLAFLITRIGQIKNSYAKVPAYGLLIFSISISFMWLMHAYFVTLPYTKAQFFQAGIKEAFAYAREHEHEYNKIIVSNGKTFTESYMYYLFFSQYDPKQYHQMGGTKSGFFTDEHFIDKYAFLDFPLYYGHGRYKKEKLPGKTLYLTNPNEIPTKIAKQKRLKRLKTLYFPNGTEAIWILEEKK